MHIKSTVVSLPVQDLDKTLIFYKNVFGLRDLQAEEGIIAIELPSLSLFMIEVSAFEKYSRKAGLGVQFPNKNAGIILSCALSSKEDVDAAQENARKFGGSARSKACVDEAYGGYMVYIADPDGHLWELVHPPQKG